MTPDALHRPAAPVTLGVDPLPNDLKSACREMERYFYDIMIRTMRQAMAPVGGKGADGFAKETATSMLDGQWARLASEQDGLGLWQSLYDQLAPKDATVKPEAEKAEKNGNQQSISAARRSFRG